MCELCAYGLASPDALHAGTFAGGTTTTTTSGKTSFTTAQAADRIADYGWTNAATIPITYAFRASNAGDFGFEQFNSAQIVAAELALQAWSDVANIQFQRVGSGTSGPQAYSNDATMLFSGDTNSGGYAWAYFPGDRGTSSIAGDVFLNTSGSYFSDMSVGEYEFMAVMHEVGHALGLDHPGTYNGGSPTYAANAEYAQDSRQYTIMSYFDAEDTGATHGYNFAATPLLHDIAAAQLLYGANMTTRTGDTTYGFNSNAGRPSFEITSSTDQVVFAVWDAGGVDTLNFSGYSANAVINLNQEAFSNVGGLTQNIAIAKGAVIENAIGGSGADAITGNGAANLLEGGSGADQLFGGAGSDLLDGGLGQDTATFSGYRAQYMFVEVDGSLTVTDLIAARDGIDNLIDIDLVSFLNGVFAIADILSSNPAPPPPPPPPPNAVSGTAGDDTLAGTAGVDLIDALAGNDTVEGGGGNDTITAGDGDDRIIYDGGLDAVNGGADYDTIDFSAFTAAVSVDLNLTGADARTRDTADLLTGTWRDLAALTDVENVNGTAFGDYLRGNAAVNVLIAGDGNDTLDGGLGADWLEGGAGDDTYVVDNIGDVVIEVAGGGQDEVRTAMAAYQLAAEFETLIFAGALRTGFHGTGNDAANTISGSGYNDVLDGSAGDDTLIGGLGNDTYVVDSSNDQIIEASNRGGADLVQSSSSYALGANVENLTLTGADNIDATGNGLVNGLTGNAGQNVLDGGLGRDRMVGGDGDDTYYIDDRYDIVTETNALPEGGIDTVRSTMSTTLGANVENLQLLGTAALSATGNAGANELTGNDANNTLNGGLGADTLIGRGGNDIYVVDNAADQVAEAAGGGIDLVQASVTFTLADEVENLTLTGRIAINGTGNALANAIVGNTMANVINGGAGDDILTGGLGVDTFVFIDGAGHDRITDYRDGTDKIDLSGITGLDTFDQLTISSPATRLAMVTFGDIEIQLSNLYATQLTATDFIL